MMNNYLLNLCGMLVISLAIISCAGDDDDDDDPMMDDDKEMTSGRLPQAFFDQFSLTASFMMDTDLDGDDDIIIGPADGIFSADVLLVNDGKGFFEIKSNAFPDRYQGNDGQTVNITSGDFNGDGREDIIASTIDGREATFSQSAKIHLYLNNGDNSFADATSQITGNLIAKGWIEWIRVGDYNQDGHLDFVTTTAGLGGEDLSNENFIGGIIYLNDGNANFSATTIRMNDHGQVGEYTSPVIRWDGGFRGDTDRFPLDIFSGDVDNDGDDDLVAPNGFADGQWVTLLNISSGTEVSFDVIFNTDGNDDPFDETRFKNGALMDINGDGFLDVIGSTSIAGQFGPPEPVFAFLNDGKGQFKQADNVINGEAPGVFHAREWLVADFNGDQQDDLFIADHGLDFFPFPGFPNTLLLSAGGSLTNSSSNVGTVSAFTHGAAVGDIDNDGDLDIFMNNHQGLEGIDGGRADSFIYLNNGSGSFTGID